jgi:hypothetical protein
MPALLHGLRIYTDTSLTPDLNILQYRNAGIGVFLFGSTEHYNINVYIKISLLNISFCFLSRSSNPSLCFYYCQQVEYYGGHFPL